jgi:hypothetical protein
MAGPGVGEFEHCQTGLIVAEVDGSLLLLAEPHAKLSGARIAAN